MKSRWEGTLGGLDRRVDAGNHHPVMQASPAATPMPALTRKSWLRIAQLTLLVAAALIVHAASAQSMAVPQPSRGLMPNPAAGKALYEKNCASCHGVDLEGSKEGPPFLHSYYVPSHHGDAAFQIAVKNGAQAHHWQFGDMQAVPGLSPDEVAHITAYVRAQQRRAGLK